MCLNSFVPDQMPREEALDTTQSFILEAPAGSGKTALLTARFLALLSKVSHPLQIMAVTFTRKAAAEMADRIIQALKKAEENHENKSDSWESLLINLAQRAIQRHLAHKELLKNPETFKVGTFHSFCASLIRSWPFEAELPPGLRILEDFEQQTLIEQAVNQYLNDLVSGKATPEERQACERRLASLNNNFQTLTKQLEELLQRRDRLEELSEFLSLNKEETLNQKLLQRIEELASLYLKELQDYFLSHLEEWNTLKEYLVNNKCPFGEILPESIPGISLKDVSGWKNISKVFLTKSGIPWKKPTGRGFPKGFDKTSVSQFITQLPHSVAKLLNFVKNWPEPERDIQGIENLVDMIRLISGVLSRFKKLLREQGLDYVELELGALRALNTTTNPSESLIFYHEHLRHILVDEAQDLNDIQVKILGKLTEGWEPGDGRTIFLVGDPKQSIYRFRRAEVSLFYTLMKSGIPREGEPPLPLKPLRLKTNFRSRPNLIEFTNQLFEEIMRSPCEKYDEVKFSASVATREKGEHPYPITAALFYQSKKLSHPDERESSQYLIDDLTQENCSLSPLEREANWVAASVAKLHRENPEETIAILIPVRTRLSAYIEALNRFGVQVQLMEGIPLIDCPEVRHLLNIFRALIRPFDDLAWAGTIRSPWIYVENQILANLSQREGIWERRILSSSKDFPQLQKFAKAIEDAKKMFGRESYALTLQRLWEDLDGPQQVAARYGTAGIANVRTFLKLLTRCNGLIGEDALQKITHLLKSSYSPPDPWSAFSNIFMMTIHKAKGLEFDHVFAVDLNYDPLSGGRGKEPAYLVEQMPGEERHLLIAASGDKRTGVTNLAFTLLKDLVKHRSLAEARRLFYVVTTRARESLTLTGIGNPTDVNREEIPRTPLEWLLYVYNQKKLTTKDFMISCNPEPPEISRTEKRCILPPVKLPPFEAEPLPYRMSSPSKIEDETLLPVISGAEEEDEFLRARGVVIHRILDTLALQKIHPNTWTIAAALMDEGLPLKEAKLISEEVLKEALNAWECPEFKKLLSKAKRLYPEWSIEDYDGKEKLRIGRIDLVVETENSWFIIDYKTSKPEGDLDSWMSVQKRYYYAQLTAYKQMLMKLMNLPEEKVNCAILFTAIPKLLWQDSVSERQFFS